MAAAAAWRMSNCIGRRQGLPISEWIHVDREATGAVALMDEVCPPSTVYGAFNAYAGEKVIVEYEFNNHEGGQGYQEREQMAWLGALFGVD